MSSVYFYEPFFSLDDFQRLFDGVFDRAPSERRLTSRDVPQQSSFARGLQPRMDIHESPESNFVTAWLELPGLAKEDVSIDVQRGRLIVSGEQTISNDINEEGFVHRERRVGRFERSLPLPTGTLPSDIKASLENGLLTITFPKSSPEQLPQKVTIS